MGWWRFSRRAVWGGLFVGRNGLSFYAVQQLPIEDFDTRRELVCQFTSKAAPIITERLASGQGCRPRGRG